MGEQAKKSDAELAIARNSRVLEGAQEDVAGVHPKIIANNDFTPFAEDFLDPQHPLYGTLDEHGRPIPKWLEQITIRCPFLNFTSISSMLPQTLTPHETQFWKHAVLNTSLQSMTNLMLSCVQIRHPLCGHWLCLQSDGELHMSLVDIFVALQAHRRITYAIAQFCRTSERLAMQVLKLGFTVGIIPSLNIAAGLIGFCGIKGFVALARATGLHSLAKPFTR